MKFTLIFLSLALFQSCLESEPTIPIDSSEGATSNVSNEGLNESCNKSKNLSNIIKPTGVYTSVLTARAAQNSTIQGGLVRVTWANLETSPGVYDWDQIDNQLSLLPTGKKWSLGIHGGWSSVDTADPDLNTGQTYPNGSPRTTIELKMTPSWLESTYSVETFEMEFRKVTVNMPKYWDVNLQNRLKIMLDAVAARYKSDSRLMLVYVPQMTSNGIEGHFNGVPNETLISAAGINPLDFDAEEQFEEIWVNTSLAVSKMVANAFDNKPIAFEVHEVIGRTSIPISIMDGLLKDTDFESRAGVAMWWIDGDDTATAYQTDLVAALQSYEGDLYGQVIGNSSQDCGESESCVDSAGKTWSNGGRFSNGGYQSVFELAKKLCMRYIEPWNYEFENSTNDQMMVEFNNFASTTFE